MSELVVSPLQTSQSSQESLRAPFWVHYCMFLVYIDDVSVSPLSGGSSLSLYADDMLLFKVLAECDALQNLQLDVDEIANWSSDNHLTLNPIKWAKPC